MISSPQETAIGPADNPTKRRIHLHIGAPKTGTTALQYYLYDNRELLRQRGFIYPTGLNLTMAKAHHPVFFAVSGSWWHPDFYYDITGERLPKDAYREEYHVDECLRELRFAAANSNDLILSSEGFFDLNQEGVESLRQTLAEYDVSVVLYLRRQDQFIEAMYRQFIMDSGARFRLPIDRYLDEGYVEHCYYLKKVDMWADVFGADGMTVVPYEPGALKNGDVICDFLQRIGMNTDGLPTVARANESRPNDTLNALSVANAVHWEQRADAADYARFLRDKFCSDGEVSPFLSRSQAIEFLDRFSDENQELARKYLGRSDGRLFDDAFPEPSDRLAAYQQGVSRDQAVGLLQQSVDLLLETPDADSAEIVLATTALFKASRNALRTEVEESAACLSQLDYARQALDQGERAEIALQEKVATLEYEVEQHRLEIDQAQIANQRLENQADQSRLEAERAERDLVQGRDELEKAQLALEQVQDELTQAQHDAADAWRQANQAEYNAERCQHEMEKARGELAQAKNDAAEARLQTDQAQQNAERAQQEMEQARGNANWHQREAQQAWDLAADARADAETFRQEAEQVRGEFEHLQNEAETAQSENTQLRQGLEGAQAELVQLRCATDQATAELNRYQKEAAESDAKSQHWRLEAERFQREADEAGGKADRLRQEGESVRQEADSARQTSERAVADLAAATAMNQELDSRMRELLWIMEQHVQRGEQARTELQTLRRTFRYRILFAPSALTLGVRDFVARLARKSATDNEQQAAPVGGPSRTGSSWGLRHPRKAVRFALRHPRKALIHTLQAPWQTLRYTLRQPRKAIVHTLAVPLRPVRYVLRQPRKAIVYAISTPWRGLHYVVRQPRKSAILVFRGAEAHRKESRRAA